MRRDINEWISYIQVLLDFQKDTGEDIVTARFDRRDLIELKTLFKSMKEVQEKINENRTV